MRSGRNDKERSAWREKRGPQLPARAMGYAEMKNVFTHVAASWARTAITMPDRLPFDGRVSVAIVWHEADHKRDPDGVDAGAKFVLDGLVKAGVLRGDKAANIAGRSYECRYGAATPGAQIELTELTITGRRFECFIPQRFPDMNEIIVAVRQDGILTERTRQARRGRS